MARRCESNPDSSISKLADVDTSVLVGSKSDTACELFRLVGSRLVLGSKGTWTLAGSKSNTASKPFRKAGARLALDVAALDGAVVLSTLNAVGDDPPDGRWLPILSLTRLPAPCDALRGSLTSIILGCESCVVGEEPKS